MDKPFKTIEQQMAILRSRNMDVDPAYAGVLKREGYYSVVNGYKAPFLDFVGNGVDLQDVYRDGTSLGDVYRLFKFDRDLRLTMMRYFAEAEAALKTVCAYRFSEVHQGEKEPYLIPANYRSESSYQPRILELIDSFKSILHKPPHDKKRGFKREYIHHYVRNHDETPLWVLTNFLMLGQVFKFYEYQNESMRNYIAKGFSELYRESHGVEIKISQKRLRMAFDHIKDFRNICAHDERLYCARVSPGRDMTFASMLGDLELVLSKDEHARMQGEIIHLLHEMMNDLGGETAMIVLDGMGVTDLSRTFFSFA